MLIDRLSSPSLWPRAIMILSDQQGILCHFDTHNQHPMLQTQSVLFSPLPLYKQFIPSLVSCSFTPFPFFLFIINILCFLFEYHPSHPSSLSPFSLLSLPLSLSLCLSTEAFNLRAAIIIVSRFIILLVCMPVQDLSVCPSPLPCFHLFFTLFFFF